MAKFRRHHERNSGGRGAFTGRLILIFILIVGILVAFVWFNKTSFANLLSNDDQSFIPPNYSNESDRFYLPTTKEGTVIHHKYYSLSYNEAAEQAEWVAYYLSRTSLQKPNVPRSRRFNADQKISTGSAQYYDYRGSGYDRGHLVPAADMAFSQQAMQETFLMSNISPQIKQFNGGVWKELEESVRDWAYKFNGLYVVTGPHFGSSRKTIGESRVRVPEYYYKALLDLDSKQKKGIAFYLPNKVSYQSLDEYALSIDELESIIGINFFDQLMEDPLEDKIESTLNINLWPLSQKRFDLRNTKWNRIK